MQPLFQVTNHVIASPHEYVVFIAIGITGALLATVYMKAIRLAGAVADRIDLAPPVTTTLAGLAVGITALQVP